MVSCALCFCLCCHAQRLQVDNRSSGDIAHLSPSIRQAQICELSPPSWLPSAPSPLHPRGPGSSLLRMTHALLTSFSPSTALHCNWRSCCPAYLLRLANTGSEFNRYKRKAQENPLPTSFPSLALGAYANMKIYRYFAFLVLCTNCSP